MVKSLRPYFSFCLAKVKLGFKLLIKSTSNSTAHQKRHTSKSKGTIYDFLAVTSKGEIKQLEPVNEISLLQLDISKPC